jgi:hypothetical protein
MCLYFRHLFHTFEELRLGDLRWPFQPYKKTILALYNAFVRMLFGERIYVEAERSAAKFIQ